MKAFLLIFLISGSGCFSQNEKPRLYTLQPTCTNCTGRKAYVGLDGIWWIYTLSDNKWIRSSPSEKEREEIKKAQQSAPDDEISLEMMEYDEIEN
jgi:hypothetical protein